MISLLLSKYLFFLNFIYCVRKENLIKVFFIFLVAFLSGFSVYSMDLSGELSGNFFSEYVDNSRPNVIVIDVDRMNKERMPCYGHYRNTTPNMCEFGEDNILFEDAVTQSGWTASSVATIFTGRRPGVHGVIGNWFIVGRQDSLPEDEVTLAEVFREEGYTTAAFPVNGKNVVGLQERYNLDQGFEKYHEGNTKLKEQNKALNNWLEEEREKPVFLFIQGFDPHYYNTWDGEYRSRFRENYSRSLDHNKLGRPTSIRMINGSYMLEADNGTLTQLTEKDIEYVKAQYDDALYRSDRSFEGLLDTLKRNDLYSNSIIIVTSNHGENLNVRNESSDNYRFTHGSIHRGNINVPLMMRAPDEVSATVEKQVGLIDLYSTIKDEAGIEETRPDEIQSKSFAPLYRGKGSYNRDYIFTLAVVGDQFSVRNKTWKYVDKGSKELYNLETDPYERNNVVEQHPEIAKDMQQRLERQKLENKLLASK